MKSQNLLIKEILLQRAILVLDRGSSEIRIIANHEMHRHQYHEFLLDLYSASFDTTNSNRKTFLVLS
ncbi:hypothetical protein ACHQM5_011971 [Ranunculus cassubicifolius]